MDVLGVNLRRMGTALFVFGVVGLVIATIAAIGLLGGAAAARTLDDRLADNQANIVAALDRVDSTMSQVVTTTANASTTLATTSATLASARDVLGQVADTAQELSTSIDISILGSRPLAGTAARFGELATQVRSFQGDAARLADNLAVNADDVDGLASEIDLLRVEIAKLTARVDSFEATGEIVALLIGGMLLLAMLAAWLAVAGLFCAWLGLRLRRAGAGTPTAGSGQPTGVA